MVKALKDAKQRGIKVCIRAENRRSLPRELMSLAIENTFVSNPLAIIDKRRSVDKMNTSEVMNIIGNVEGKTCILIDDMIDTAGTICHAADALAEAGATHVYASCTHPVLSGPALDNIQKICY